MDELYIKVDDLLAFIEKKKKESNLPSAEEWFYYSGLTQASIALGTKELPTYYFKKNV